jgi:TPR repeat protein
MFFHGHESTRSRLLIKSDGMTAQARRIIAASTVALALTIFSAASVAAQATYDLCPLIPASGGALAAQRAGSLASRSNAKPLQVIRDLEEYTGLPPNSFSLWPTNDVRVRNNAAAQACQGQRFIFYDESYFMSMGAGRSGVDWTKYFAFAHEVGHHQLNHFDGPPKPRRQKELEADEHAGFLLARMKIPSSDLIMAVDTLEPSRQPPGEYPGQCERREAAIKGYNLAARQMGMPQLEFVPPCSVRGNLVEANRSPDQLPQSDDILLRSRCDKGDLRSCVNLGLAYLNGRGVSKDTNAAANLFMVACDGNDPAGCVHLGDLFLTGEGWLKRDPANAAKLYQKACDGGDKLGCTKLAQLKRR